jgi:hypothetical protein
MCSEIFDRGVVIFLIHAFFAAGAIVMNELLGVA